MAATAITVGYGNSSVSYSWNGTGWDRSQDGAPTVDTTGARTSPTTVIVQFVDYRASSADGASPEAVTVGEGTAWIFTEGHVVKGRWRRNGSTATTSYVDSASGNPIAIVPGRTWIELPRPGRAGSS
ncbi:MAG: DUF3048 C-terminal domain-containing protein [Acidimicrobiales bacterium]